MDKAIQVVSSQKGSIRKHLSCGRCLFLYFETVNSSRCIVGCGKQILKWHWNCLNMLWCTANYVRRLFNQSYKERTSVWIRCNSNLFTTTYRDGDWNGSRLDGVGYKLSWNKLFFYKWTKSGNQNQSGGLDWLCANSTWFHLSRKDGMKFQHGFEAYLTWWNHKLSQYATRATNRFIKKIE